MTTSTTDSNKIELLVKDILSLQQTLEELFNKVEGLKEEESQLSQENEILVKYINNLMQQQQQSSVNKSIGRK
ncbi:hypothetical protein MP638_001181 [Amoeboaphelidium occidentale]|nr:hypothetical protein MP638_001181 [Amoeboaphelidium occidentale]